MKKRSIRNVVLSSAMLLPVIVGTVTANAANIGVINGYFQFNPLASSTAATPGGNPNQPLVLPDEFKQTIIASEPNYGGNPDMNTLNETGE